MSITKGCNIIVFVVVVATENILEILFRDAAELMVLGQVKIAV